MLPERETCHRTSDYRFPAIPVVCSASFLVWLSELPKISPPTLHWSPPASRRPRNPKETAQKTSSRARSPETVSPRNHFPARYGPKTEFSQERSHLLLLAQEKKNCPLHSAPRVTCKCTMTSASDRLSRCYEVLTAPNVARLGRSDDSATIASPQPPCLGLGRLVKGLGLLV